MDTNSVHVVVQSTVHQEEMIISNDMLILDVPCEVYAELVEKSSALHDEGISPVCICGNNPNTVMNRDDATSTKVDSSVRASMEMAYLCTSHETYSLYHHEQNAPLMLCQRTTDGLAIKFTTRLSYGATHRLTRPNFALITQMIGQSHAFSPESSDFSDTPRAFTRHDYLSAVPGSEQEVDDELFCRGLRGLRAPYLQVINPDEIEPVVDALVTQLVGIQLQDEQAFPAITKVPFLLAVDALREVYHESVLSYAVDIVGDMKALGTTDGRGFSVVYLNLRGYIRHKIHCCFVKKQILSGIEMESELLSRIPLEIVNVLRKETHEFDLCNQMPVDKTPNLFPFSQTFFRGIAIQTRHTTTRPQVSVDNTHIISHISNDDEFQYVPFWNYHSSDAETTWQSLLHVCREWSKADLACYLLPFFHEESTEPVDDCGLYDDWAFARDYVRRMNAKASRHDGLITDDHQEYIKCMQEGQEEIPGTPNTCMRFHCDRGKKLDTFLSKNAKEMALGGEVVYTSNDP